MADEHAAVGGAVVGDGLTVVGGDDVDVEVDEPLAAEVAAGGSHAVRGVAGGAREPCGDVGVVLIPTRVLHDLVLQVVAFAAQCVRARRRSCRELGKRLRIVPPGFAGVPVWLNS